MLIAQCWDDGVATDIGLIGLLRKYNAKATFNLCPGFMKPERLSPYWVDSSYRNWSYKGFRGGHVGLDEIVEVYGDFEVASHTWSHTNADAVAPEFFMKEALDARHFLEDRFQRECRGFAWPCGVTTPETCRRMHEAGFLYGRTVKYTGDVTDCSDTMQLASCCHFQDHTFFDKYEAAKKGSGVFYFWGHSYEMLDYPPLLQQFELKLQYIANDPDAQWVNVVDLVPHCKGAKRG